MLSIEGRDTHRNRQLGIVVVNPQGAVRNIPTYDPKNEGVVQTRDGLQAAAPFVIGWIKDSTGSFYNGLYALGGFMVLAAVVTVTDVQAPRRRAALAALQAIPAE